MFGYMPDADIAEEQHHAAVPGRARKNRSPMRCAKTHWVNIDLIPACLALYEAEMAIAAHVSAQEKPGATGGVFSPSFAMGFKPCRKTTM